MKIIASTPDNKIARVFIAQFENDKKIEMVCSTQPPYSRCEKLVLIISTLFGCPIGCKFCDAGGNYKGKLSKDEMLKQIDFLIKLYYKDKFIPVKKFKIQFARMGEPSLNNEVLEVLKELPKIYNAPGFLPSISTVFPKNTNDFFVKLKDIKNTCYKKGNFQIQFSLHTTNEDERKNIIPAHIISFCEISEMGNYLYDYGDRKITLNFAISTNYEFEPQKLLNLFSPDKYILKLTPVNPTVNSIKNNISSYIRKDNGKWLYEIKERCEKSGYDYIISIGEWEENKIGSNCGQYILNYQKEKITIKESYTYLLKDIINGEHVSYKNP